MGFIYEAIFVMKFEKKICFPSLLFHGCGDLFPKPGLILSGESSTAIKLHEESKHNQVSPSKIIIIRDTLKVSNESPDTKLVTFEELKQWVLKGSIMRHLFHYREANLLTYRLNVMIKPFLTALLMRLLSRGECLINDEYGQSQFITVKEVGRLCFRFVSDSIKKKALLRQVGNEVEYLSNELFERRLKRKLNLSATPIYLRTDLWFGVAAGGSVGHISGVLNHLEEFTDKPIFLTSDHIPTVRKNVEVHRILPKSEFWDFNELPSFNFNETFQEKARNLLNGKRLSFIYQRYSLNNYSGVKLAQEYGKPFVLEYNGSEIWINRHWGKPLKYESLSGKIEILNLRAADLIVVVSKPMRDELVERGIDPDKILVNPNGVDPELYSPDINGSNIRGQFDLRGKVVVGFIGTFGRWHGAEKLAEAFGKLLIRFPEYRKKVRLLMIGDGLTMPEVKRVLLEFEIEDVTFLTGLVPQQEGPIHMAACDILVSPHVPNPDGTPFFGSPTKLFEYMAMGKGIVASNLDQIGDILCHNKTGWMVKPGDVQSLMGGLKKLIDDDQLRNRLGQAARREVMEKYTWKEHTRKIVEKIKERCQ